MLSQKSSEWSSLSSGREILQELYHKEAGVFWARECTFSYEVAILDLARALEGWGDGKLAEVVGAKWRASTGQEFNYNPKWRHRKPSSSEDPPSRQGIPETLNFWTFHSSSLLLPKGPFNIKRPLCGMSCSLRSKLAHLLLRQKCFNDCFINFFIIVMYLSSVLFLKNACNACYKAMGMWRK